MSGASELVERARAVQERVQRGELDLREVGKALDGKWDQDLPAAMLSALAELSASRAEVVALREALKEARETFATIEYCAKNCIKEAGQKTNFDLAQVGIARIDLAFSPLTALAGEKPVGAGVETTLRTALLAVVAATRAYLPPDGIDAQECLNRILAATDNPTINPCILEAEHGRS